jgi:protein SCO1/2
MTVKFSLFALTVMVGFASCQSPDKKTNQKSTMVADHNLQEVPEMSIYNLPSEWTTQDRQQIRLSDLKGDVLVIAMIYTSCQFACPRLVAEMKEIEKEIPPEHRDEVNIVLVSIDPENDQPDSLKKFAIENQMDSSHWTLLHGSEDNVLEFAAVLGVKYQKISPVDFSHSNIISVFNRLGVLDFQQEGYGDNQNKTVNRILNLLGRS